MSRRTTLLLSLTALALSLTSAIRLWQGRTKAPPEAHRLELVGATPDGTRVYYSAETQTACLSTEGAPLDCYTPSTRPVIEKDDAGTVVIGGMGRPD